MSDAFQRVMFYVFVVAGMTVVFVRAGQFGGRSGGAQSADILKASGSAISDVVNAATGAKG